MFIHTYIEIHIIPTWVRPLIHLNESSSWTRRCAHEYANLRMNKSKSFERTHKRPKTNSTNTQNLEKEKSMARGKKNFRNFGKHCG